jgi:NAD(P)-dependent dehydrogenase (short-subunit alcohol dehydrogenase family)
MRLLKRMFPSLLGNNRVLKLGRTKHGRAVTVEAPAIIRQLATVGSGRLECNAALVAQALDKGWKVVYVSDSGRDAQTLHHIAMRPRAKRSFSIVDLTASEDTELLMDELTEREIVFVRCVGIFDTAVGMRRHYSDLILNVLASHLECKEPMDARTLLVLDTLFARESTPAAAMVRLAQAAGRGQAVTIFGDSLAQLDSDALDAHITHSIFMRVCEDEALLLRPAQLRRIAASGTTLSSLESLPEAHGIIISAPMDAMKTSALPCKFEVYLRRSGK